MIVIVALAAVAYVSVQGARPAPAATISAFVLNGALPGPNPSLSWPSGGEAALGVAGMGNLYTHGPQTSTPIASIAKIMTAFVVLRDRPLASGAPGPEITINPAAVTIYHRDKSSGQSVVQVHAGEQLSERQALEGLLLPSGNNVATILAIWVSGSVAAFVKEMNATARSFGLSHTHYADASGVSPSTVSTAADQVRLAMAAMQLPAFRQLVDEPQVELPVAGLQYNVNALLGTDGIVGVKTGFTPGAGGCFVFAAKKVVSGHMVTVVGAVLRQRATAVQPSALEAAFSATTSLLSSAQSRLEAVPILRPGRPVGVVRAPWSSPIAVDASISVTLVGLPGLRPEVSVFIPRRISTPIMGHREIGVAVVNVGGRPVRVPLVVAGKLPGASFLWRLFDV